MLTPNLNLDAHEEIINTLNHETAVAAEQYIYTPHISTTPLENSTFQVIGAGDCRHKLDMKNIKMIETWTENVLRTAFRDKGIFKITEIKVAGDIEMNIVVINMMVERL